MIPPPPLPAISLSSEKNIVGWGHQLSFIINDINLFNQDLEGQGVGIFNMFQGYLYKVQLSRLENDQLK